MIHYLTCVDNENHPRLKQLLTTAAHNEVPVTIIIPQSKKWRNWLKGLTLLQHLEKSGLQPTDWIIFIDAFDVLVMEPLTEADLEHAFSHYSQPDILYGKDRSCYPHDAKCAAYEAAYINGGLAAGTVQGWMKFLGHMYPEQNVDFIDRLYGSDKEQYVIYESLHRGNPAAVAVDSNCLLFQNIYDGETHVEQQGDTVINTQTSTMPKFLHFPGANVAYSNWVAATTGDSVPTRSKKQTSVWTWVLITVASLLFSILFVKAIS